MANEPKGKIEEKQGSITAIRFHNEGNGYTVAVFETAEGSMIVVGNMIAPREGGAYILRGRFVVHPKFGEQFSFSEWEETEPEGEVGITAFLASGIIKGIGPVAAAAIVKMFGDDTFRVIEEEPELLTKVNGIGQKKAAAIADAYIAHKELAEIAVFFQQYDISVEQTSRLYSVYGADTIRKVQDDPYAMIDDIFGVGFVKADRMAQKMGFAPDDDHRVKSGVEYMLQRYIMDGHVYVPRKELVEESSKLLGVQMQQVDDLLVEMAFASRIVIERLDGEEVVYKYLYRKAEAAVAHALSVLESTEPVPIDADIDSLVDMGAGSVGIIDNDDSESRMVHESCENGKTYKSETGVRYSREQRQAIKASLTAGVSVITGGPGTGKTTIIKGILDILSGEEIKTVIAAPTGRAAKRITETTGYDAQTIHRLLEYSYSEDEFDMKFGRNEENPLDAKAIIIDEASMIDLMLMDGLLKAIRPGSRLILVGDVDQLPSVGAGNILRDIIESEYVTATRLTEIFRQAGESMIVVNAHRINEGDYPECNSRESDFFFLDRNGESEMLETIKELCVRRLPDHYGLEPMKDIQVLSPVRKGTVGVLNLNKELQTILNPPSKDKREKTFGPRLFREGDKVMQIRNNYEKSWRIAEEFTEGEGVFNGDIGVIEKIDEEYDRMIVIFDENKYTSYDFGELDQLETAYAVTVHKSQGSEFPVIVMPMSWFPPMLATRNLLYTAITRGKMLVVLVGSRGKMQAMVDNNQIRKRYSGLKARLKKLLNIQLGIGGNIQLGLGEQITGSVGNGQSGSVGSDPTGPVGSDPTGPVGSDPTDKMQ